MQPLSLFLALAFLVVGCGSAEAAAIPKAIANFAVGNTHVDKYGSGEPALILIPGLTDSAAVWKGTIAHFAPTHTVYALTLAGFGGTKPDQAPMIDKAVADIAALIAQEHLNKPVIIGHSLGGFTALRFAAEHGDLIRGAVAADGTPVLPGMDTLTAAKRAANGAQMSAQMSKATPAQLEAFEKANILPYMVHKENVDAVAAAGAGADPAASGEYMRELMSADIRPALANISVPLLELVPFDATLDPFNPQGRFATGADKLAYYKSLFINDKTAQLQLVDNSRHFVMFDQPQAFYEAVSAFLKALL